MLVSRNVFHSVCLAVIVSRGDIDSVTDVMWETIREFHTFTNRKTKAALMKRENSHLLAKKNISQAQRSKQKTLIFLAFHIQTNTHWLRSSFLTGSLAFIHILGESSEIFGNWSEIFGKSSEP